MKRIAIVLALFASPALAQQSSPSEQALADQLIENMRSCITVRAALVDAQRKLHEAEAKIKLLEAKKPDDK